MKGILIVAIVAIVVILAATSIFMYSGLQNNTVVTTSYPVFPTSPGDTTMTYTITFVYASNPIFSGLNQTITIEIVQGSYQISSIQGILQVNSPSQKNYQIFGFTTDANGEASFAFPIALNATGGVYNVFAIIESLGEVIQNTSSSFEVVS